ncbi:MAG: hypothetical protein ABIK61_05190 [candidate division WOR-3 bacterium]
MKYTININQLGILYAGLISETDLIDWAIVEVIKSARIQYTTIYNNQMSKKAEKTTDPSASIAIPPVASIATAPIAPIATAQLVTKYQLVTKNKINDIFFFFL